MKHLFRPVVFSRHPTHNILRKNLPLLPFRSVIRLGSTTELSVKAKQKGSFIECNSIAGISRTSNKLQMKLAFINAKVHTPAIFCTALNAGATEDKGKKVKTTEYLYLIKSTNNDLSVFDTSPMALSDLTFPLIGKILYHSRGRGMVKLDSITELKDFLKKLGDDARKYTFEKYTNFLREYRVHATHEGIFYICRKLRKEDAKERWFFNSKNSIFEITYENGTWIKKDPMPCFKEMEQHCIQALKELKMDIAGFDIRVNGTGERFTIIEANSACSFGEHTAQHYIEQIPKLLKRKAELQNK